MNPQTKIRLRVLHSKVVVNLRQFSQRRVSRCKPNTCLLAISENLGLTPLQTIIAKIAENARTSLKTLIHVSHKKRLSPLFRAVLRYIKTYMVRTATVQGEDSRLEPNKLKHIRLKLPFMFQYFRYLVIILVFPIVTKQIYSQKKSFAVQRHICTSPLLHDASLS